MSEIYTGSMSSSEQAQVRLGGMALRNGVLVQGPDHWAAAVRTPEGEIRMASGRKPELPAPALSVPGLRGVLRVAEAIYLLPLVRRTLDNVAALVPERALTGPVARGDEATVAAQRQAVAEAAPELLGLFDELVEHTRALAAARRTPA